MAQTVKVGIVRDRDFATGTGGDTRRNPHVDQSVAEPISVVSTVSEQGRRLRNRGQERPRPDVIRGMTRRQEHPDRAALGIGHNVQFRVQTTLRPPDQPSAPPF